MSNNAEKLSNHAATAPKAPVITVQPKNNLVLGLSVGPDLVPGPLQAKLTTVPKTGSTLELSEVHLSPTAAAATVGQDLLSVKRNVTESAVSFLNNIRASFRPAPPEVPMESNADESPSMKERSRGSGRGRSRGRGTTRGKKLN